MRRPGYSLIRDEVIDVRTSRAFRWRPRCRH